MTMQHQIHPDDERLAALAGGDPEVVSDAALRAHVDSCDQCAETVRELGSLRAALAELPDLVPSRPLQLLPPVAEPRATARAGWLRRLAGPAMAAGLVLVVVGAIGSSGSAGMAQRRRDVRARGSQAAEAGGQDSVTGQPHRPPLAGRARPSSDWLLRQSRGPAQQGTGAQHRPAAAGGATDGPWRGRRPVRDGRPAPPVAGGAGAGRRSLAGGDLPALRAAATRRLSRLRR